MYMNGSLTIVIGDLAVWLSWLSSSVIEFEIYQVRNCVRSCASRSWQSVLSSQGQVWKNLCVTRSVWFAMRTDSKEVCGRDTHD